MIIGPNGWQGTPHGIQSLDAQGKKLLLGPEIVDYLRDGDLIVLRIPEADIEIDDYWPDVPISWRSTKGESLLGMPNAKETVGPKASYQADELPQAHLSESVLPDLPPVAQPVHGRAYWQELLSNDQLSGQELYAASQETRSETDLVDIAKDFLRLAANKGHNEALKEYAGLFDPMKDLRPGDRRIENPGTALEYYRRLSATGDQTATSDIESLCAHLKPKYFENADARIAIDDYCN